MRLNSTKPRFVNAEPVFYRCSHCGRLLIQENQHIATSPLYCCDALMSPLEAGSDTAPRAAEHRPHIVIAGGFEANVIHVSVGEPPHPMAAGQDFLEWIYLYTFQGGQIKFIGGNKSPTATFALEDEDAYVYCDRPVCKGSRCKFNCKRGFTAYAYCNRDGLWKTAL